MDSTPRTVVLALAALTLWPDLARGLDGEGITVTGTAQVTARANAVEMIGLVSGEAELARDAIVKYQDNKRRAIDALEDLNIDELTVEAIGFSISQAANGNQMQRMMMGQPADNTVSQVRVSEPLRVTIEGIDQIEPQDLVDMIIQVIDAGKDAGLEIGAADAMNMIQMQMRGNQPQPLARFKLKGVDDLKQQAYEQAMDNARGQAERLAAVAGVKLGRIVTVRETEAEVDQTDAQHWVAMVYGAMAEQEDEYTSEAFVEIPVTVGVRVQFEIEH